jgi:hypothetical protein
VKFIVVIKNDGTKRDFTIVWRYSYLLEQILIKDPNYLDN